VNSELVGAALLDGDGVAGGGREVDGAGGGGDVERDAVGLGGEGHGVGADLVGDVAVGGDAVGADDHQVDLAAGFIHHAERAVGEDRVR
jgi:hypothetical protein